MRYFKNINLREVFCPEIHLWLAENNGLYLFVLKDTDKWTPYFGSHINDFQEIESKNVPAEIRKKAGQRLGAFKRNTK